MTFTVGAAGSTPLTYQWLKGGVAIVGATSATYTTSVVGTGRRRRDVQRRGHQFRRQRHERRREAHGDGDAAALDHGAVDHDATVEPDCGSRWHRDVHRGRSRLDAADLPMVEGRRGDYRCHCRDVHDARRRDDGRRRDVHRAGQQCGGQRHERRREAHGDAGAVADAAVDHDATVEQTAAAGGTATFTVVATGSTPLSYQWSKGGVAIAGATAATYTTPIVAMSDDGAMYGVLVSNAAGNVTSGAAKLTVMPVPSLTPPSITTQPSNQTAAVGEDRDVQRGRDGSTPLSYQWSRGGVAITGATAATYTTPVVAMTDDGATYTALVSNSAGNVTSGAARLTVTPPRTTLDLLTYKYGNSRLGQNTSETVLTPANVTPAKFGLLRQLAVDGKVDAQPLYLGQLTVNGALHNVVYVVTEHGSAYAFDADTGATLWHVSLIPSGETTSEDVFDCDQIVPEIGITATPVIDRNAGAMYVVAMSKKRFDLSPPHTRTQCDDGRRVVRRAEGNHRELYGAGLCANELRSAVLRGARRTAARQWHRLHHLTSHCDTPPYTGWIWRSTLRRLRKRPCSTSHRTAAERDRRSGWPAAVPRPTARATSIS